MEKRRPEERAESRSSARMESDDNEATLRLRQLAGDTPGPEAARQEAREGPDTQRREAREPAPGEADPASDPKARPLDRRERSP